MTKYIIRRVLIAIPVLIGITIIVYCMVQAVPGGPLVAFASNPRMSEEQKQKMIAAWGLDQPLYVQYWKWFTSMIGGNWGYSLASHKSVGDEIWGRVPATLTLMLSAFVLQEIIALPLGILSALRRNSLFDKVFTILAYIGYSMPTFWFALMMIYFFAVSLNWFPAGNISSAKLSGIEGYYSVPEFWSSDYFAFFGGHPFFALQDLVSHLVLPVIVLAVVSIAADSRYMRSSMLETINQDYIRTARAKGLSEGQIVRRHAIRPALLPVVTNITLTLPTLIGGAVVTETLFNWPGMGLLFINAVSTSDYPVVMGIVFVSAILIVVFNIIADIMYSIIDPRIRYA